MPRGRLAAQPSHILSVFSTGLTNDGSPYLAMELLTGGSLSDRVPLPPDAVAALGARLANALQLAHNSDVIHRDVKPSNVLFNRADEPVLVDFGISSLVGEASTSTGEARVRTELQTGRQLQRGVRHRVHVCATLGVVERPGEIGPRARHARIVRARSRDQGRSKVTARPCSATRASSQSPVQ
jgi:serine/threonine protein kinase